MGESLEFPDVLQEVRGAMNPGRLKLQNNNIIFKNIKTGLIDTLPSTDIEKATWLIRARGYCLKVLLANGNVHRFDGFKESEFEKLSSFMKSNYEVSLKKKDMSVKGWNWGVANFVGNSLEFDVDKNAAFDIPLGNVSHSVTAKNEVTLEFHQNDDAAVSLMELRFHIPSDVNPDKDTVNEFYENVLAKADIIQAVGDAIANFTEVQCLTPRGRYDIKIYQSFMQLHGKTFDYKIPYTTILRLFLLPHKDGRQMFFVVSLDPPIKQGQTRYHFLILLFNKEYETNLEIGLSEQDLEEKYEGKLTKSMSGPEYEIISRVMKTLVNRKITVPGTFVGHSGTQSIGCSYKAATGFLYPLERGFIFVHKPPIHIRFDEVANVNFARSSGSNRSFDFEVETKTGNAYTFVGIEKDEYGKLYDFVKHKKLRVKNIGDKLNKKGATYDEMMGSDEEGGHHDAYLERMKAEGKEREDDDDDDEDSEEDEDFNPGADLSEPDDEFDSDPESTDSEAGSGDEGESREKPKKKTPRTKTVSEAPRKQRSKKKDKDSGKPKRPQSAYFLWLNAHRDKIKQEFPGISITELSKKAGERWKEVKDRSEWDAKAAEEKKNYEIALREWKEADHGNSPASSPKAAKKRRKKQSPSASTKSPMKGSGANFKSKEFISDSDSAEETPKKKKEKKSKAKQEPMDVSDEHDGLPTDESEAEMTDGSAASGSESGSGSEEEESGSGSGDDSD